MKNISGCRHFSVCFKKVNAFPAFFYGEWGKKREILLILRSVRALDLAGMPKDSPCILSAIW